MMDRIEDDEERKSALLNQIQSIRDKPAFLEKQLIITHLNYLNDALGADHPYLIEITDGQPYEEVADQLIANSGFATAAQTQELLEDPESAVADPAVSCLKTSSVPATCRRRKVNFRHGLAADGLPFTEQQFPLMQLSRPEFRMVWLKDMSTTELLPQLTQHFMGCMIGIILTPANLNGTCLNAGLNHHQHLIFQHP